MSTNAATHTTLMPGTAFPSIMLDVVGGEKQNVSKPAEGKNQLLVFYRGAFCPFCKSEVSLPTL